jgi:hypothetical protein
MFLTITSLFGILLLCILASIIIIPLFSPVFLSLQVGDRRVRLVELIAVLLCRRNSETLHHGRTVARRSRIGLNDLDQRATRRRQVLSVFSNCVEDDTVGPSETNHDGVFATATLERQ